MAESVTKEIYKFRHDERGRTIGGTVEYSDGRVVELCQSEAFRLFPGLVTDEE